MDRMLIADAVMMLPVDQQLVLSLHYEHGWSVALIADQVGMTQAEVRRAARRAVETVAPLLRGSSKGGESSM